MPRRDDIHKILLIGSGPIVIGQACEFDYSGTQACKALREEGYEVVLVNSNPATIMTDPEMADRTYIEPLTWEIVAKVIEVERPDALLPTLGGQTGLNLAMDLARHGVLEKFGVEMIGANAEVIAKAEERDQFKAAMERIGLEVLPRRDGHATWTRPGACVAEIGLPCVVRPSFTLGGTGSSIAYNREEFDDLVAHGLEASPDPPGAAGRVGHRLERVRDGGDARRRRQRRHHLLDRELRPDGRAHRRLDHRGPGPDAHRQGIPADARRLDRRDPRDRRRDGRLEHPVRRRSRQTGRMVVIEMNPRVSRSSALASKATGFPIAKIAAKLAVGYRLDELPNDITRETLACFEPTIDYVVTKIPRFAFEKFPEADADADHADEERGRDDGHRPDLQGIVPEGAARAGGRQLRLRLRRQGPLGHRRAALAGRGPAPSWPRPTTERVWYLRYAIKYGMSLEEIFELTAIDPWFLENLREIVEMEDRLRGLRQPGRPSTTPCSAQAKQYGFSDRQLATIWGTTEMDVRAERKRRGIVATFKAVDTCAAEFEAYTPYYYSTYEDEDETPPQAARASGG